MKRQPDAKLTLRENYEKHYDTSELKPTTVSQFRFQLTRWEKFSGNPAVVKIDNELLHAYRQACIEAGYAAASINKGWTMLRAILRRIEPNQTGNPRGLGIVCQFFWMKPVKGVRRLPRRVTQDDLSLFYIAADVAQFPRCAACPPAEYWRALIVVAYFTGMRRADLFSLESEQVDLNNAELRFTAKKTGKDMTLPLHPCVVHHLQRIWTDGKLFARMRTNGDGYCLRWQQITRKAGVEHFTLHDVRRTAASEVERVKPGMGSVLLQHRPLDVTGASYLNQLEELKEAVNAMRVPLAFKHGPKKTDRAAIIARKERERIMREATFQAPTKPDPTEWKFEGGSFWFRGAWHNCCSDPQLAVLRELALSPGSVDYPMLAAAVYGPDWRKRSHRKTHGRICGIISTLRNKLRQVLYLGDSWNPVPCIERGDNGKWMLFVPRNAKGTSA